MATSLVPWMMTRGRRRDMARALGVPLDYFEGMGPAQQADVPDQDRLEFAAYLEALMNVVAERTRNMVQGL